MWPHLQPDLEVVRAHGGGVCKHGAQVASTGSGGLVEDGQNLRWSWNMWDSSAALAGPAQRLSLADAGDSPTVLCSTVASRVLGPPPPLEAKVVALTPPPAVRRTSVWVCSPEAWAEPCCL